MKRPAALAHEKRSLARAAGPAVAGVLFDDSMHYLDHLGPLCALMNWPLAISDPFIIEMARAFYPSLHVIEIESFGIAQSLRAFSHLVSCSPKALLDAALGAHCFSSIWLPHGNSDKGLNTPLFQALRGNSIAFVYGQQMEGQLKSQYVNIEIVRVGHFRCLYYQKMKSFYDALPLTSFSQKQRTILYAPTWDDSEGCSSVWQALPHLAERLPQHLNLLVKLHPNTLRECAPEVERMIGKYTSARIQFLDAFSPILPLLARCDVYLGDRSSIGYDFLHFNRPLFFLGNPSGKLVKCGRRVTPQNFFRFVDSKDSLKLSERRQVLYAHTFDSFTTSRGLRLIFRA